MSDRDRLDLWDCDSAEVFENLYRLVYRDEKSPLYLNSLNTILKELDQVRDLVELRIDKSKNNKL